MLGLQTWFSTIFEWEICWFLMSQPIKSMVNSCVFIRFHFFDFFMNCMISGTHLDLILDTLGGLGASLLWFLGLLYRHWNFNEILGSLLPPKNKSTWSFGGFWLVQGGTVDTNNLRLLTCKPANTINSWLIIENIGRKTDKWLQKCLAAWWPLASRGRRIYLYIYIWYRHTKWN